MAPQCTTINVDDGGNGGGGDPGNGGDDGGVGRNEVLLAGGILALAVLSGDDD